MASGRGAAATITRGSHLSRSRPQSGWATAGARASPGGPAVPSPFPGEFSSSSLVSFRLGGGGVGAGRPARDLLRLAFARDAGPHERVVAGPGQVERIPLALLTDRAYWGLLPVE